MGAERARAGKPCGSWIARLESGCIGQRRARRPEAQESGWEVAEDTENQAEESGL